MQPLIPIDFSKTDITGGFWAAKQTLIRDVTIHAVRERFEETGRFRAFRFDWNEKSDAPKPHFFWDSDVAKWLESAAYLLQKKPDPALEAKAEEIIDLIQAHQEENGYFNIYHTVVEPENRLRDRDHHELYCLGHLIEAGVAYYHATGRDRLLQLLDKYIDLVTRVFTVEHSAGFTTPGHEEIELALFRLYRLRRDKKYLDLAMFFLNERGTKKEPGMQWCHPKYMQSHLPVRQQHTAEGHAVRACYLYCAMADAAAETGDAALLEACKALFDDIATRKMYITGGIGSSSHGEAFTVPYDLPNDTAYAETCAAIALALFAARMRQLDFDSKYADVIERAMYNGILAGLSLDGKAFFYENPLEINLADRKRHASMFDEDRLPITERLEVFTCSCCPPNVTRFFASLGSLAVSRAPGAICVDQFFPCAVQLPDAALTVETNYPHDGNVRLTLCGAAGQVLYVRVPGWCESFTCDAPYSMERGYAKFAVDSANFTLHLDFAMPLRFYTAHPAVRADAGRRALMRGPLVYCLEGIDNDAPLFDLAIDAESEARLRFDSFFGANVITLRAEKTAAETGAPLYATDAVKRAPTDATFIPYYAFANRGETDMRVWVRVKE